MLRRREFLHRSLVAGGAALFAKKFSSPFFAPPSSADSRIEIVLDEPIGAISPNHYGHFAENLSGVIYDGIWVGEDSKIPNVNGIRKELIDEMRLIKPAVVRYPGGCFADSYDWRDGIGPRDKRPRRTNFWAGEESPSAPAAHRYDPNQFGTNEFMHFCKLIGSQPYLAANLRSLSAEEFYRWVEYCNSPAGTTTSADMRAAAGYPDTFDVRFWGVGNESWGCGGNFTSQEYAVEFRRYTTWVPSYGRTLSFIASGPNVDDWNWTRGFFEELVREGKRMETLINGHWQIMAENDPEHSVKLVVDEWGPWYKPGSEATPGDLLEQMPTLRDAVFSGMTLDIFNRHPEKIAMANCAQLINCLNSLYLAHENKFCVTPVGHVVAMYAAHQGGQAVRSVFTAPDIHYDRDGKPASFWALNGSASLHDKTLVVTIVNPSVSEPRETQFVLHSAKIKSASATVLTHSDIHAHNTFEQRRVVTPQAKDIEATNGILVYTFPPASVTKLVLELA